MKKRRVKFVWGASRVIKGRWFFGLFGIYDRAEGHREDGLAISLRGLMIWSGALAVVLYVAATLAVFQIWQRNPYSVLTYEDALFYPFRRSQLEEKKGQALIAQGQDLFRAQKWLEAAKLLRLGLERYPRDFRARFSLAQFYLLANQRSHALRLLQDGLHDEYPGRVYLEMVFKVAADGEDHDLIAQTGLRYVPRLRRDGPATELRWLMTRTFEALIAAERPAEALALAESGGSGETAKEQRVLALLAMGRAAEASAVLAEWRTVPGATLSTVARLQARAFRESQKFPEMERALAELRTLAPADPAPLVYAIVQQAMAGREAEANASFDDFIFRFGGTEANLGLLASPLAEIGHLELLQRCVNAAAERGYARQRFQALLLPTQLQRGNWDAAAETLAVLAAEPMRSPVAPEAWRVWMERLLACIRSPTDASQIELVDFLRRFSWPARVFRQSIDALMRAERFEAAREVAEIATASLPMNKQLRALRETVAAQIAARDQSKPAVVAAPAKIVISERPLPETSPAVTKRAAPPADDSPASQLAELRERQRNHDLPGVVTSARLFLNGDRPRSQQILDVAREFFADGDKEAAQALVKEVLRKSPNFPPAQRLLKEWAAAEKK